MASLKSRRNILHTKAENGAPNIMAVGGGAKAPSPTAGNGSLHKCPFV